MFRLLFALLFTIFSTFSVVAQTIISDALDFTTDDPEAHALYTVSGDYFIGQAIFIRNDTIGFQIRNLSEVTLYLFEEVRFLGTVEESIQSSTNITLAEEGIGEREFRRRFEAPMPLHQLLYSYTALPYEGKGVYTNTMVLANQVDFQLGDHFALGAGALIPALVMIKAKAQISASEMLHVGLGAHQFFPFYDQGTFTHPYVIVTVGNQESYLNFTGGYWIERYSYIDSGPDIYPMVTVAGSFAFAPNWRFFAEAAAVVQTGTSTVLPTFNFSNRSGRGVFEFGIMAIPDSQIPVLPLLSYHRLF
ncbi:MAG: hypothetical protein AAFN81_31090 [Bacteroidota bacterium]